MHSCNNGNNVLFYRKGHSMGKKIALTYYCYFKKKKASDGCLKLCFLIRLYVKSCISVTVVMVTIFLLGNTPLYLLLFFGGGGGDFCIYLNPYIILYTERISLYHAKLMIDNNREHEEHWEQ